MGSTTSKEAAPSITAASKQVPKAEDLSAGVEPPTSSGCPMHKKDGSYSLDPFAAWKAGFPHGPSGSKPLTAEQQHTEYNVYGQKINPDNQMPTQPNQQPAVGQQIPLSTERVKSTIPKGGTVHDGTTWTYPSPQMFYNALARKKKLDDDTSEHDMESVVAVHNQMNEQTWVQILHFERTLGHESPKLLKFNGRPTDLSPKAALKHYVFGHPLPFDRHDWLIERNNGETVRYVLDYYAGSDHSLHVDVRPALDRPMALLDRGLFMPYAVWRHTTDFTPLPLLPNDVLKEQYDESKDIWKNLIHGGASSAKVPTVADMLKNECQAAAAAISSCKNEAECQKASIDLTLCLGKRLCDNEYKALQRSNTDDGIEAALQRLQACVDHQQQ